MFKRGATKKAQIMSRGRRKDVHQGRHDGSLQRIHGVQQETRHPLPGEWSGGGTRTSIVLTGTAASLHMAPQLGGTLSVYETDWMGWGEMARQTGCQHGKNLQGRKDGTRGLLPAAPWP